jgi:hypothetical protein
VLLGMFIIWGKCSFTGCSEKLAPSPLFLIS